jgi:hypothetical protein
MALFFFCLARKKEILLPCPGHTILIAQNTFYLLQIIRLNNNKNNNKTTT